MRILWLLIGASALFSAGTFLAMSLGSIGALMLTYIAPLPLFILGLAKGGSAVGASGAIASMTIALASNPTNALIYLLACALPVSILCEKATQSRKISGVSGHPSIEWYPPGPLCMWLIATPTITIMAMFCYFQIYHDGLEASVTEQVENVIGLYRSILIQNQTSSVVPGSNQLNIAQELLSKVAPALLAIFWIFFTLMNGVLAQFLLGRFGKNLRPTPELGDIQLSRWLIIAFIASLVFSITIDGPLAYLGTNLCGILAFPLFLSGLGVSHVIAEKTKFRFGILIVLYSIITVTRWGSFAMVVLGLIDHFAYIKSRVRGNSTRV